MQFTYLILAAAVGPLVVKAVQWQLPDGAPLKEISESDLGKRTWLTFMESMVPSHLTMLRECAVEGEPRKPRKGSELELVMLYQNIKPKDQEDDSQEMGRPSIHNVAVAVESPELEDAVADLKGSKVRLGNYLEFIKNKYLPGIIPHPPYIPETERVPKGAPGWLEPCDSGEGHAEAANGQGNDIWDLINNSELKLQLVSDQVGSQNSEATGDVIPSASPVIDNSSSETLESTPKRCSSNMALPNVPTVVTTALSDDEFLHGGTESTGKLTGKKVNQREDEEKEQSSGDENQQDSGLGTLLSDSSNHEMPECNKSDTTVEPKQSDSSEITIDCPQVVDSNNESATEGTPPFLRNRFATVSNERTEIISQQVENVTSPTIRSEDSTVSKNQESEPQPSDLVASDKKSSKPDCVPSDHGMLRCLFSAVFAALQPCYEFERVASILETRAEETKNKYLQLFDEVKASSEPEMFTKWLEELLTMQKTHLSQGWKGESLISFHLPAQGQYRVIGVSTFDALVHRYQTDGQAVSAFEGSIEQLLQTCYREQSEGCPFPDYANKVRMMFEEHYFYLFDQYLSDTYYESLSGSAKMLIDLCDFVKNESTKFIQSLLNNEDLLEEYLGTEQATSHDAGEHSERQLDNNTATRNSNLFNGYFCLAVAVALFLSIFLVQASGNWTGNMLL